MAQKKRSLQPIPKDTTKNPNCVKHGCCSCKHKDVELSKFPCNGCHPGKEWLYWEDANPSPALQDKSLDNMHDNELQVSAAPKKRGRPRKVAAEMSL